MYAYQLRGFIIYAIQNHQCCAREMQISPLNGVTLDFSIAGPLFLENYTRFNLLVLEFKNNTQLRGVKFNFFFFTFRSINKRLSYTPLVCK